MRRVFSTCSKMSKEYIAIIKDKPNALSKRMDIRSTHLENIKPLFASQKITVGGAFASEHNTTPDFKGSILSFQADSKKEVLEILNRDVYNENGVWDLNNVEIFAVSIFDLI